MASLMQLFFEKILSAISALNTTANLDSAVQKCTKITVYVVFGAATSAGTFVIETSHDPTFAGTWETQATIAWAAASSVKSASVSGPFRAARVRCSVAVVGGTADVYTQISA